jgi:hypothetical protein
MGHLAADPIRDTGYDPIRDDTEGLASDGGGSWLAGPERFVTDGDGGEWVFRWGDSGFGEEQDNPVGWGLATTHRGLTRSKYASS